jgi:hypothetical protein
LPPAPPPIVCAPYAHSIDTSTHLSSLLGVGAWTT